MRVGQTLDWMRDGHSLTHFSQLQSTALNKVDCYFYLFSYLLRSPIANFVAIDSILNNSNNNKNTSHVDFVISIMRLSRLHSLARPAVCLSVCPGRPHNRFFDSEICRNAHTYTHPNHASFMSRSAYIPLSPVNGCVMMSACYSLHSPGLASIIILSFFFFLSQTRPPAGDGIGAFEFRTETAGQRKSP